MKPEWKRYLPGAIEQELPMESRYILLQFPEDDARGIAPSVVVGYLKFETSIDRIINGEPKYVPVFITQGFERCGRKVSHWADCLGDDFDALPNWKGGQC